MLQLGDKVVHTDRPIGVNGGTAVLVQTQWEGRW